MAHKEATGSSVPDMIRYHLLWASIMKSQPAILTLFKEQLENESAAIAQKFELGQRGHHLIWWYFTRLHDLSPEEVGGICCDGGGDLGIDAIWIDDEQLVHFYQFKNPVDLSNSFPSGDVDKTLAGLRLILFKKHEDVANEELRARIGEIYQTLPTGYRLHFVSSGAGLEKEAKRKLEAFSQRLQGPSDSYFQWTMEDLRFLQDMFYKQNLPAVEDPIRFGVTRQPYMIRSADHDCYLLHVSGQEAAQPYGQHGEKTPSTQHTG